MNLSTARFAWRRMARSVPRSSSLWSGKTSCAKGSSHRRMMGYRDVVFYKLYFEFVGSSDKGKRAGHKVQRVWVPRVMGKYRTRILLSVTVTIAPCCMAPLLFDQI